MYQAVLNTQGLAVPGDGAGALVPPSIPGLLKPWEWQRWQGFGTRLVLRHPAKAMGGSACGRSVFYRTVEFTVFVPSCLCISLERAQELQLSVLWETSMNVSSLRHEGCVWMTHCSPHCRSFSLLSCGIEYPRTELNQHLENILSLSTLIFQSCFSLHA